VLEFPNTAEVLDGAHRLTSVFVTQFVDEMYALCCIQNAVERCEDSKPFFEGEYVTLPSNTNSSNGTDVTTWAGPMTSTFEVPLTAAATSYMPSSPGASTLVPVKP